MSLSMAAYVAASSAAVALAALAATAAALAATSRSSSSRSSRLCENLRSADISGTRPRLLLGDGEDEGQSSDARDAVAALTRVRQSWEACRAQRMAQEHPSAHGRLAMFKNAASEMSIYIRNETIVEDIFRGVTSYLMSPMPNWSLLGIVPRHERVKLVLDLDETLVHTFVGPPSLLVRLGGVEVVPLTVILSNQFVKINVALRPFVREFLRITSQWFDLAVFTAGDRSYADPIIDYLDGGRGILAERYYRRHCQTIGGYHLKDLRVITNDLSRIVIIDDSETGALLNPNNCIGIKSWQNNPFDRALLDLIPGLAVLSRSSHVPSVLSI
mmetsp:Transcript_428/g.1018  ORF Transcript_428/g.1018 Transcript_428/m.1018 type:complete len:329 (+) Transcript_428:90-1076(+)